MDVDAPHVRQIAEPSGAFWLYLPYNAPSGFLPTCCLTSSPCFLAPGRPLTFTSIDRRDEQRKTCKEHSPFSKKHSQMASF